MRNLALSPTKVAHDLTEQRRLALLRLAAMHGDTISSEDAAGIVDEFVTSRSQARQPA